MTLKTKHFGDIDIDELRIITFKEGLPGFKDEMQFILLIDDNMKDLPFYWMQSIHNPDLAFVLIDAMKIMPHYIPELHEDDLEDIGDYGNDETLVLNILAIPQDFQETTVNLLAPIIINNKEHIGKQIVALNANLKLKHRLFDEIALKDGGI